MTRTPDELSELRERCRDFSQRIDAMRPVLGDDLTRELIQVCDAGVILGNHAVPFAQIVAQKDAEIAKLKARILDLDDYADDYWHHVTIPAMGNNA